MSPKDDPVSIRPNAREVMMRRLILTHFHVKARATPPDEVLAQIMTRSSDEEKTKLEHQFGTMFSAQEEKIRSQGLWDYAEDSEREFFQAGVLETTMRQRIDASWMVESIACLDWALRRRDELSPYDREASPETVKFKDGERAKDLIEGSALRDPIEITMQRDIAELWHWRCRTHMLLASKRIPQTLPDGTAMAEVIRLAAVSAAQDGIIDAPIGDDFPALGKPFRALGEEEMLVMMSIAMERHKAWNWLCGYAPGNHWCQTPTHT